MEEYQERLSKVIAEDAERTLEYKEPELLKNDHNGNITLFEGKKVCKNATITTITTPRITREKVDISFKVSTNTNTTDAITNKVHCGDIHVISDIKQQQYQTSHTDFEACIVSIQNYSITH